MSNPTPHGQTSPAEAQLPLAPIHGPLPTDRTNTGTPITDKTTTGNTTPGNTPSEPPPWLEAQRAHTGRQEDSPSVRPWQELATVHGSVQQNPRVLRGHQATQVRQAPVTTDLRGAKPTMIDPQVLEQATQSAAAAGYAHGWAEGQRAAQAQVQAQAHVAAEAFDQMRLEYTQALHHALAQLAQAADDLETRMAQPMGEVENELITAAVELTETLLGHQLRWPLTTAQPGQHPPTTQLGLDAVRRALTLAPTQRPVTVRLHPDQARIVEETLAHNPAALEHLGVQRPLTIVPDATLGLADCVADCDATRIDAQLPAALQRVRALLATPPPAEGQGLP